jgi:hypothetical protein
VQCDPTYRHLSRAARRQGLADSVPDLPATSAGLVSAPTAAPDAPDVAEFSPTAWINSRTAFSPIPAIRAHSRKGFPRSRMARNAAPAVSALLVAPLRGLCLKRRHALGQPLLHRVRALARRKNTARSSMLARVRRASSSCAATAASRAARRAAFVVAPLGMAHTLNPAKPLMPHPKQRTFPPEHPTPHPHDAHPAAFTRPTNRPPSPSGYTPPPWRASGMQAPATTPKTVSGCWPPATTPAPRARPAPPPRSALMQRISRS